MEREMIGLGKETLASAKESSCLPVETQGLAIHPSSNGPDTPLKAPHLDRFTLLNAMFDVNGTIERFLLQIVYVVNRG
ncbi:unnamed protein product [Strongylus vulgaris]|uniref:Uncharacterized protein n=1 Tax=Strongylus vulgaris TaxID=40348 RepID=A0A3P7LN91_STRVU|nr:unnamed protein product [Strongylus vulgaris]